MTEKKTKIKFAQIYCTYVEVYFSIDFYSIIMSTIVYEESQEPTTEISSNR